jgi:hypothetical protein
MQTTLFFLLHKYRLDYPNDESPENFVSYVGEEGLRQILIEANGRRIIWKRQRREPGLHDAFAGYRFEEPKR